MLLREIEKADVYRNSRFVIKLQKSRVGDEGFEHLSFSSGNLVYPGFGEAKAEALKTISKNWSSLPDDVKEAITVLFDSSKVR